jgi:citrate lyase beta subunit
MADMNLMRVLLFTPATHPEYIGKAAASGADGMVIDLEDGVALEAKEQARTNLLALLNKPRPSTHPRPASLTR